MVEIEIEVSVIIPAFNCAEYIEKAIDSVLCQRASVEIVVINDSSGDCLEQVLDKYLNLKNFVYIKNKKNLGTAESRNIGVRNAKGKYIAFLDADDWWVPDKLEKQLKLMQEKCCVMSCTGRELVENDGTATGRVIHVQREVGYNQLLRHNSIACSSVLILKKAALEYPMRHSEFHEDYLTWLLIAKDYGSVFGIDEPLLLYRLSKTGKSRNKLKSAKMTYGVYRVIGISKIKSVVLLLSHLSNGILKYYMS